MKNSDRSLKGKTALITGGTKRIGYAIALTMAEAGINILIHYNRSKDSSVNKVLKEIRALGVKCWKVKADFSSPEDVKKQFSNILKKTGNIDYLINNASIFHKSTLRNVKIDEIHNTLNINSISPLILSQVFARQTSKGVIINILDDRINRYDMKYAAYQLSKDLLLHLTEMMAIEYAPGIRVNAISPGLIIPPTGESKSYFKRLSSTNLLNKHGDVSNISDTVLFLLKNDFISGEVIFVDGGRNLKGAVYGKTHSKK